MDQYVLETKLQLANLHAISRGVVALLKLPRPSYNGPLCQQKMVGPTLVFTFKISKIGGTWALPALKATPPLISGISVKLQMWYKDLNWLRIVLFPGSVWNSDCLKGIVTNASPRHEAKFLKTGYSFFLLLEDIQSNKHGQTDVKVEIVIQMFLDFDQKQFIVFQQRKNKCFCQNKSFSQILSSLLILPGNG